MPSIGFIAYASALEMVGDTIEAALDIYAGRQGRDKIASWRENDVAGRFIIDPILQNITASQCLIADISLLNFNVTYEVGYAIGNSKRVVLVKNKAIAGDETELKRVGIFDTLGYATYENAEELYRSLASLRDFTALKTKPTLNSGAPVYLLQLPFNTDAQGRIIARLKKARKNYGASVLADSDSMKKLEADARALYLIMRPQWRVRPAPRKRRIANGSPAFTAFQCGNCRTEGAACGRSLEHA